MKIIKDTPLVIIWKTHMVLYKVHNIDQKVNRPHETIIYNTYMIHFKIYPNDHCILHSFVQRPTENMSV